MSLQDISIPSYNPADVNDQSGLIDFFLQKNAADIQKVIPAKIISYDRNLNRATIQILTLFLTSTGQKLQMKSIPNIPVLTLAGGGFVLSFPVQAEQIGFLLASDRDISLFKQNLTSYTPATNRQHQYEDSIFIPLNLNGFTINEADATALLISSLDGATKLSIQNNLITMTAANVVINGNTTVNGTLTATDTITSNVDVISETISGKTHTHTGVTTGSGTTGQPQ